MDTPFRTLEEIIEPDEIPELARMVQETVGDLSENAADMHARFLDVRLVNVIIDRINVALGLNLAQIRAYVVHAAPGRAVGWHRDGSLLNAVNTLNIWIPLYQEAQANTSLLVMRKPFPQFAFGETRETGRREGEHVLYDLQERVWLDATSEVIEITTRVGDCVLFDPYHFHSTSSRTKERFGLVLKCADGERFELREPFQRFFCEADAIYNRLLAETPDLDQWMRTRYEDVIVEPDHLPGPWLRDRSFSQGPHMDWYCSDYLLTRFDVVTEYRAKLLDSSQYDKAYFFERYDEVARLLPLVGRPGAHG